MRLLAAFFAFAVSVAAQNTQTDTLPASSQTADVLLAPAQDLVGKATFLRCLCADSKISYDETGKPLQAIKKPVDWTLAAVNVEKVERKDGTHIELTGTRTALRFNEYSKTFDRRPLKLETVRIEVAASTPAQLRSTLANVVSIGIDFRLQQSTSFLWKHYFNPSLPWPEDALTGKAIFQPNPKDATLVAPKLLKRSEFDLTEEARQNRVTGSILFKVTVGADGAPHRVMLVRPLGFGLDDLAAAAILKWRFAPGTKDGQPVAEEITIEEKITPAAPRAIM